MSQRFGLTLDQLRNPGIGKDSIFAFLDENGVEIDAIRDKSIAPIIYFHQQALPAAAGTLAFFGTTLGTAVTTNMKNGTFTLPQDEHMIMTGLRILYGAGATLDAIDWDYGATVAVLKNAKIQMIKNNISQLNLLPLTAANPELTTDDQGRIDFLDPILWKAQTYIQINVTTAAAPAANGSLRIEVWGIGLIS